MSRGRGPGGAPPTRERARLLCGAAGGQRGAAFARRFGARRPGQPIYGLPCAPRVLLCWRSRVYSPRAAQLASWKAHRRNPRAGALPALSVEQCECSLQMCAVTDSRPPPKKNTAENPRATNNHALRNSEPGRSVLTSLAETSTPPNRRPCGGSGASMTSGMRPERSARPAPSSRNVAGARQAEA